MCGIATKVKDVEMQEGAEQALYRLNPPLEGHEYVVVSGVDNDMANETYIFPASEEGEVTDWGELDGSFRGGINHARALANAGEGYTIQ